MAERINTAARNLQADAIGAALNSGTLKIYTGAQPASANDAASGTLLWTGSLPADAYDAASGGTATAADDVSAAAGDTGTAGWFRMESADTTLRYDGAITATGGGGEIELDSTSITSGQTVIVTPPSITQPAS